MYLLDTNVISELRKAKSQKASQNVINWAKNISPQIMFISVITILELEIGILLIEKRDPIHGAVLRAWLNDHVLATFAERILDINLAIAQRCAKLHVPDPRSDRDAIIAATALVYGMTVVTRNINDFAATTADLLNPWELNTECYETP